MGCETAGTRWRANGRPSSTLGTNASTAGRKSCMPGASQSSLATGSWTLDQESKRLRRKRTTRCRKLATNCGREVAGALR